MKMRFWQKTFVFTLVIFLICLNLGILSLAIFTHRKNINNAEHSAITEQRYIAISFERDYDFFVDDSNVELLMRSYGKNYYGDTYICFMENGQIIYTNFQSHPDIEKNTIKHTRLNNKRHIVISSSVCEEKYTFIFAKDFSNLDLEFNSLMTVYVLTSFGVSFFLAICLYFVLKKLSDPLEKLRLTTLSIEKGDFDIRAEEKGKDEFALLAKSFNSMLSKINEQINILETDSRKKQMLIDNMAHELRTPLTSISGYAEILEKASVSEENRIVSAKYILSESKRLQKISEILLDSAFVRENEINMEKTDLADIINEVCEKLEFKASADNVSLVSNVSSMVINGNGILLSMLFYNLIENGIKACSDGGIVEIYEDKNKIIVEDNGKGITSSQLEHITEPFYRTDKSRSRADGGAGLGLYLCKEIATSHGLELAFQSAVGVGTKIIIDFTSLKNK